jgi:general secretion pathway protein G
MAISIFKPKSASERRIFFPWEGRGTFREYFAVGRVAPVVVVSVLLLLVWFVGRAERQAAGERLSLVAMGQLRDKVEHYLAQHEGKCPTAPEELLSEAGMTQWPVDGWGQPIRLLCPADRADVPYLLMSDGPDGEAGGLDRIEY